MSAAWLLLLLAASRASAGPAAPPAVAYSTYALTAEDQAFLEDLSRRSFMFFWEQADPVTGLVFDRGRSDGSPAAGGHKGVASAAATGFGLSGLCVAARRRWVEPRQALDRARTTLRFLAEEAPREHGWFYHWMDAATGARVWESEVSSIDTALLLAGVLTARRCFAADPDIGRFAKKIYERVEFPWLLDRGSMLLRHGWKPETGFLKGRWDTYTEHAVLNLLAMGSPTHPIPARAWRAWRRDWMEYDGIRYLNPGTPLFTHQYSHAWVDFRNRREKRAPHVDFFANSILATRAHRAFCLDLAREFPGYTEEVWGITASDGPKGYEAWGGPPRHPAMDGTVAPCAAAGSLMFAPELTLPSLKAMKAAFGERIYGRYGFADAFHPVTGWVSPYVLGIDAGITLLSAENLRAGTVWAWFMANPEIESAMKRAGLDR